MTLNGTAGVELATKLVSFLERPNSKIVDVSLSVLGNLAMYDKPREAIIGQNGVNILVKIISNLAEEKILGRACRVIANLAVVEVASSEFHNRGTVPLLLKTIRDVNGSKPKGAAIRAIRILCEVKGRNRKIAAESNAVALITSLLKDTNDQELLKIIIKALAVLTSDTNKSSGGCGTKDSNQKLVSQVEEETYGFEKLVNIVHVEDDAPSSGAKRKISRRIWVPAMTVLANLSQHSKLRPRLGNAGVVPAFVNRLQNQESALSSKEFIHCVNALCLYCQESVNRLKLRELGGLQFFVSLLSSHQFHHKAVHKKVLGSLVRFGYDAISMKVYSL